MSQRLPAQVSYIPTSADIFTGYALYRHQVKAIRLGTDGKDFIVTSGTGSGKSLTYIGTIFHQLLSNPKTAGVKAIVVYPMNVLINSQFEEFSRYQENSEKRQRQAFPDHLRPIYGAGGETSAPEDARKPSPDTLNQLYDVELLLTRVRERYQRRRIRASRFLVFDELHTYRGRKGRTCDAVRRIHSRCSHDVLCIGTSATMVSVGTIASQREQVAQVATTLWTAVYARAGGS